jgi:hypothetical protein
LVSRNVTLFVPHSMFNSRSIRLFIIVIAGWLGVPRRPNQPLGHRFLPGGDGDNVAGTAALPRWQ